MLHDGGSDTVETITDSSMGGLQSSYKLSDTLASVLIGQNYIQVTLISQTDMLSHFISVMANMARWCHELKHVFKSTLNFVLLRRLHVKLKSILIPKTGVWIFSVYVFVFLSKCSS